MFINIELVNAVIEIIASQPIECHFYVLVIKVDFV